MNYRLIKITACMLCAAVMITGSSITAEAASVSNTLPAAGVGLAIEEGNSVANVKKEMGESVSSNTVSANSVSNNTVSGDTVSQDALVFAQTSEDVNESKALPAEEKEDVFNMLAGESIEDSKVTAAVKEELEKAANTVSGDSVEKQQSESPKIVDIVVIRPEDIDILKDNEEDFRNLVIAQVNDYVNVRSLPSEEGEIVGKLYDESAGTFLGEEDGWYKIQSGNVTGYVKGEYCVTGEDAQSLAKEVGIRIATVTTTTLKVRQEPSTEAAVLGLIPIEDELVVTEEVDGWVKVNIEEGDGYVSMDYVSLSTEFTKAESKAEEEARLAKEEADRRAANEAAARRQQEIAAQSNTETAAAPAPTVSGSGQGSSVAQYALQFVGNPYVYGGTSLTNGADCSGFVMSVYRQFGVSLPHSSSADRNVGYAVNGLANAQPGDLICYSGHVALYIGNGQIVHASTAKTGIKVSDATYRQILAIRRIF